jgi:hypothetical protein
LVAEAATTNAFAIGGPLGERELAKVQIRCSEEPLDPEGSPDDIEDVVLVGR